MIDVKIKISIPNSIMQMQTRLAKGVTETMSEQIPILKSEIINRTQRGQNVQGGSFQAYSERYKKTRTKLGLRTSPVNLTVSGEMLDLQTKMEVTTEGLMGTISVPAPTEEYAEAHNKGLGKQPRRNFMGLSREQINKFKSALAKNIIRNLNR